MSYKTHSYCTRCEDALAPIGHSLCNKCQEVVSYQKDARENRCPVCGVEPGYACIFRKRVPGDAYWGTSDHYKLIQGDNVHKARHSSYDVERERAEVPFWKQAWHFFFGE